jgi:head-tail adaptor
MKRSQMRWALVLETRDEVADGAGGVATTGWVAVGSVFARLEAMSGREALASEAGVSRVPYRITVPAAPFGAPSRPTARQRFRHGARIFEIVAVRETGQARQFLECHAIEETTV